MNAPKANISIRQRITETFREDILSGRLKPGESIPPTQELVSRFGTREANVQRALSHLVKEGLISRRPRAGTVVNEADRHLKTVAVYLIKDIRQPANGFTRALLEFIESELQSLQIECLPLSESSGETGLLQLKKLAGTRQIQGVIIPALWKGYLNDLSDLQVPYSCIASENVRNRIKFDFASLAGQAVDALKSLGCSRAALLSAMPDFKRPTDSRERYFHTFFSSFKRRASAAGLEMQPEWTCTAESESQFNSDAGDFDAFAYEGFLRIWEARRKPDGLFVYPDSLITGTLMAILRKGLRVPGDLRLALHKNRESRMLCPVPCVLLESSIAETAAGLVKLLLDLFHGRKTSPISIGFRTSSFSGGVTNQ